MCLAILILGYLFYGKYIDRIFNPDDRETPAVAIDDGIDYVVLPQWKIFMIQLLNIAGLGPIFGAITGAMWGPAVFLWITFGTVFAGSVHDYFAGMLSERNNGASISEVTGIYLGSSMKTLMRVFSVILLVMVGTVFAVGPSGLIVKLLGNSGATLPILLSRPFWLGMIMLYYFIATFISVDKVIGRIYPLFGACLVIMAVGVCFGTLASGKPIPEVFSNFRNMHPDGTPIWSFMFISVACGAISGFHATQSPLMARCVKSERQGRSVFYGAMVAEGIIALIWAAAASALLGPEGIKELGTGGPDSVYEICTMTMGKVGAVLAMLGVIACPITSGDTAFRSARLTLADWFNLDTSKWTTRLALCLPVLGLGAILAFANVLTHPVFENGVQVMAENGEPLMLSYIDYDVIWRYFSWSNQTLAMIVLWAGAMYLVQHRKNYWVCAIPATFMSAVSMTYFMMSKECMGLIPFFLMNKTVAYPAGIIFAAICLIVFLGKARKIITEESNHL